MLAQKVASGHGAERSHCCRYGRSVGAVGLVIRVQNQEKRVTQAAWQSSMKMDGGGPQVGLRFESCRMERVESQRCVRSRETRGGEARAIGDACRAPLVRETWRRQAVTESATFAGWEKLIRKGKGNA